MLHGQSPLKKKKKKLFCLLFVYFPFFFAPRFSLRIFKERMCAMWLPLCSRTYLNAYNLFIAHLLSPLTLYLRRQKKILISFSLHYEIFLIYFFFFLVYFVSYIFMGFCLKKNSYLPKTTTVATITLSIIRTITKGRKKEQPLFFRARVYSDKQVHSREKTEEEAG